MNENGSSSELLALPREVRDIIYEYTLQYDELPPPDISNLGSRHRRWDMLYSNRSTTPPERLNLSLVCWQLKNEITDFVNNYHLRRRHLQADLDLIVSGHTFVPTWTYYPMGIRSGERFTLNVTLRIWDIEAFSADYWQPGPGFLTMLHLLEQFLRNGPSLYYVTPRKNATQPFIMDRLHVVLRFANHLRAESQARAGTAVFRMLKALADDGVAGGAIEVISARAEYVWEGSKAKEREWPVKDEMDAVKARRWGNAGFYYAPLV